MFVTLPWLRIFAITTDPRAWFIIIVLALAFFGRRGMFRSRFWNLLKPWRNPSRDATRNAGSGMNAPSSPLRDPFFVFLLVIASVAVVTWIVMSMTVTSQHHR